MTTQMRDAFIFVKLIKCFPTVDEVIFNSQHVKHVKSRLIIDVFDSVFAYSKSSKTWQMSETNYLIPRFYAILL